MTSNNKENTDTASVPEAKPVQLKAADIADLEFMPDTSAASLEQVPRGARMILWVVVAFLAFALMWAHRAELDEVTRGNGQVIPSRQIQVVQNLEGGIVSEILIKEGDIVKSGEALLKIDDVRFSSSYRESQLRHLALQAKVVRLKAEAEGALFQPPEELIKVEPEIVQRELELFQSRRQQQTATINILKQQVSQRAQELVELRAKKAQLQRSYNLMSRELNLSRPLVAEGALSEVELLRLERSANEINGELENTSLAIPRVKSRQQEAKRKVEEANLVFLNEVRSELNDATGELSRLSESNLALEDRVQRTVVRSPLRGKVKRLMVNTVGGVIQPGMDLVEIVPLEDTLLVEVRIRPGDIGFLRPGQDAVVKFTAYDFAIYGGLKANLEYISADSLTDEKGDPYYLVKVRTDKNYLGSKEKPLSIIPGMLAGVDVLTGKKTVLEYLLKPVLRAKEYALRER